MANKKTTSTTRTSKSTSTKTKTTSNKSTAKSKNTKAGTRTSTTKTSTKSSTRGTATNGNWVTINGVHVFIENGRITKGPKNLVGKTKSGAMKEMNSGKSDVKSTTKTGTKSTKSTTKSNSGTTSTKNTKGDSGKPKKERVNKKFGVDTYIKPSDKITPKELESSISEYPVGTYLRMAVKGNINDVNQYTYGKVKTGKNEWTAYSSFGGYGSSVSKDSDVISLMKEKKIKNIGVGKNRALIKGSPEDVEFTKDYNVSTDIGKILYKNRHSTDKTNEALRANVSKIATKNNVSESYVKKMISLYWGKI